MASDYDRLREQIQQRLAELDAHTSPLGHEATWPAVLKSTLGLVLAARAQIVLFWGPEYVALYNADYAPTIGDKHPRALGRPAIENWAELWDDLQPLLRNVRETGVAFTAKDRPFYIQRNSGVGERVYFDVSYSPVPDESGHTAGVLCIVSETTVRLRAEQRAVGERNQLWTLSQDAFLVADEGGRWVSVSPAWSHILGWGPEELEGRTSEWIEHPDDRAPTRTEIGRLAGGAVTHRFENRLRRRDGEYRWFSWTAVPAEGLLYCVARDVSEEKARMAALLKAEEQLRQSQKMEAVGQLTGGLAHDFNNLLTGITGSLELLNIRIAQGRYTDVDRYISASINAAKRAAALTHRLLAFARRQTLDPKAIAVNRLVVGMEDLIRRTVGPAIQVEVVAAAGLWTVLADPNQLENALLNLCINARDAMPHGGRLTIETGNRWLDESAARERDVSVGQYVSLCVSDTGTGMTPEVISKAFDPFFTTKPLGEGTGLGLSMIYGFAKQSGGQVRIYSEIGNGAMVCIYLPRHRGDVDEPAPPPDLQPAAPAQRGITVLVVDDEPTVRMIVLDVLEQLGYSALEAADGVAGLKILQSNVRIDLVISDIGLPGGLNGRQMIDTALQTRPDLRVLFITGYAENAVLSGGSRGGDIHVMSKPFSMDALTRRITELVSR